ncbi:DUF2690 domain-containing protein [Streptomyces sp. DT190]|jgi:hypothetical protein|uniref:helix-turn-helix domain-containing protein n=1 Tax=unclassified Streptomyces TaxID=2593676 RepID=UPI003CF55B6A
MTRPPPAGLPPERARLVCRLRELREGTGLSLAALAAKTTFSKSSWERYLNGRTLPPDQAVRELCRLAGEPEGRCLALWELAESEWSGRAAAPPPGPPASPSSPSPPPPVAARAGRAGGRARFMALLASLCALAAGGLSVALVLLAGQPTEPRPAAPSPSVPAPRCRGSVCEGRSPMLMKCGTDPLTLASHRTSTGAHLELRYSARCGAGWARMWSTRIGDRLELNGPGGRPHSARITDGLAAQSYVYTPMTAARSGTVLRACFRPVTGARGECFEARVRHGGGVVGGRPYAHPHGDSPEPPARPGG